MDIDGLAGSEAVEELLALVLNLFKAEGVTESEVSCFSLFVGEVVTEGYEEWALIQVIELYTSRYALPRWLSRRKHPVNGLQAQLEEPALVIHVPHGEDNGLALGHPSDTEVEPSSIVLAAGG